MRWNLRTVLTVSLMLLSAVSVSCTMTRHGRLYDLESAEILNATYKYSGTGKGPIWIGQAQATADCKGEYVTVPSGSSGWGMIYGGGTSHLVTTMLTENDQPGRAIVTCADGRVIECEYVTSALSATGSGSCEDNRAKRYRLMF